MGGSPQAVAQACAGGGQGHFGECLGSCLGCQGAGHGVRLMWGDRWGFGVSRQNSTSWGRAKSKAGVPQRSEHKRQGQQGQGQERRAGAGQEVDCRCREDGHRTGRGPCFQGASSEKKPRPHRMGGWGASAARVDGRRTRGARLLARSVWTRNPEDGGGRVGVGGCRYGMESGSEEPPGLLGSLWLCFRGWTVSDVLKWQPFKVPTPVRSAPRTPRLCKRPSSSETTAARGGGWQACLAGADAFRLFLAELPGCRLREGPFRVPSISTSPLGLFNQTV